MLAFAMDWIFVSPRSKFMCCNPNLHCDGIWRWSIGRWLDLNEIMRVEPPWSDECPCTHQRKAMWWHNQEGGPHQEPSHTTPWFQTPGLQNCKNKCVLSKPPSMMETAFLCYCLTVSLLVDSKTNVFALLYSNRYFTFTTLLLLSLLLFFHL